MFSRQASQAHLNNAVVEGVRSKNAAVLANRGTVHFIEQPARGINQVLSFALPRELSDIRVLGFRATSYDKHPVRLL